MSQTSRRAFLASTVVASAAVALRTVEARPRESRGNPFANVKGIPENVKRIPSDQYPLPFSEAEYADRLNKCRQAMSNAKIELLYVTWPEGICYLSGYEVSWFRGNSSTEWFPFTAIAVHVDHDNLLLVGGEDPIPCAAKERREIHEEASPENMASIVVKILQKEGWLERGTRVGLEYWSYIPPRAVSEVEERAFAMAGATVVDGSMVMRSIRLVKSPAEIEVMEYAAQLGDLAIQAVADHFKPGMSHCEVYAEATYAMYKAGGEVAGIAQDVQPGRPRSTHLLPSRRQIQAGEPFAVDMAGVYKRYHANVDRTYLWGDPTPELRRIDDAAKRGLDLFLKIAKSGTSVDEVGHALHRYYEEKDIWRLHEYIGGYELGIAFAPDWVGQFVWVAELKTGAVFQQNMITNYESNFRNGDLKYPYPQISLFRDTVVYQPNGARKLSAIPSSLIALG